MAGQCVRWLRDNMKFFGEASEIGIIVINCYYYYYCCCGGVEGLAGSVDETAGVYFVPAFSGLYAPHWQPDARGLVDVS